jgi:hypothetical protein
MGIWANAFKTPVPPDLTAEERSLLDSLAKKVNDRGELGDMAAFALESTRPVHHLGSQGIVFLTPMLSMIFAKEEVARYARLLENPKAVTYLVERLQAEPEKKPASQGEPNVKDRP